MNGVLWSKRMYAIKHYILFSTLTNKNKILNGVKGFLNKFLITMLYIPGRIMTKKRFK